MLIYVPGRNRSPTFLLIKLNSGSLYFGLNGRENFLWEIVPFGKINDNFWHSVGLIVRQNEIEIHLDNRTEFYAPLKAIDLDLGSELFFSRTSLKFGQDSNFEGCVHNVLFNYQSLKWTQIDVSWGLRASGCESASGICVGIRCPFGEICVENGEKFEPPNFNSRNLEPPNFNSPNFNSPNFNSPKFECRCESADFCEKNLADPILADPTVVPFADEIQPQPKWDARNPQPQPQLVFFPVKVAEGGTVRIDWRFIRIQPGWNIIPFDHMIFEVMRQPEFGKLTIKRNGMYDTVEIEKKQKKF